MRSLIIAGYGVRVGVRKGYIVIKSKEGVKEVAPSDVDQVIIATSGVSLTTKFLRLVSNYGIDLIILDSRGYPVSRFYHPYITRTVDSRLAQYMSYFNGLAKEVAKLIAYCKLMNQAKYILRLSKSLGLNELKEAAYGIESIANEVVKISAADLKEVRREVINVEAKGARLYWSSIASVLPKDLGFDGRDQEGGDLVNVLLNYSYGIIYGECWKALTLAGLDPYAGFLHTERSGRPVLTYDLIELFRVPAVDSVIIPKLLSGWRPEVSDGLLPPKTRAEVIKLIIDNLGRRFKTRHSESYMTLSQWIKHVALDIANALREGKLPKGFIVRW